MPIGKLAACRESDASPDREPDSICAPTTRLIVPVTHQTGQCAPGGLYCEAANRLFDNQAAHCDG
jgi:hypothetical protein